MTDEVEQWTEWRVTGTPGRGYPPYEFVWSEDINPHLIEGVTAESAARAFAEGVRSRSPGWEDGPHLSWRTVTRTAWNPSAD